MGNQNRDVSHKLQPVEQHDLNTYTVNLISKHYQSSGDSCLVIKACNGCLCYVSFGKRCASWLLSLFSVYAAGISPIRSTLI